jgi:hypothetical protein
MTLAKTQREPSSEKIDNFSLRAWRLGAKIFVEVPLMKNLSAKA